ncbi:hypothetical protein DAPPUDRAFT_95673 [Daphnia pulex]|uniref:Protein MIS12 homolog n=1 Tax=Daphnia pulex TaxID=6669 RepID=E9FUF4_DAPPU|nr:hypothetical protein DAPPUDRAFT_95673 [Daphnia pulex]|eukprot:EFX88931.1 hypothetical protein DAPPUDRAFT_95673 [Daphnia pulex]
MEESLVSCEDFPKENIIKGFGLLKSRFSQKMDPICSKLERFMLEVIFKVPEHVLLPEDVAQRKKHSVKDHKKILKEIESLKAEIQTEKYKKVVLNGKLKEATETLENLRAAASEIENTSHKILWENQTADVKENSQYIVDNIEKYKTQLDGLRELVPPPDNVTVFRQKENDLFKRY